MLVSYQREIIIVRMNAQTVRSSKYQRLLMSGESENHIRKLQAISNVY